MSCPKCYSSMIKKDEWELGKYKYIKYRCPVCQNEYVHSIKKRGK